ncbi:MAG: hypothetical protein ABFS16_12370 [Bacteroidota bacterium]
MKQTIKLLYLASFLSLLFISCEERVPAEVVIPAWLQPRIEELESSEHCNICEVQRSTYLEEHYFHVYCGHWSCMYCEVYHYDGRLVDWEETSLTDFLENRTNLKIIWECPQPEE